MKTNIEAVHEIARQLRLRNIGLQQITLFYNSYRTDELNFLFLADSESVDDTEVVPIVLSDNHSNHLLSILFQTNHSLKTYLRKKNCIGLTWY